MANICPCKGCVPPKRHSTCHDNCPEYLSWNEEHIAQREARREATRREHASDPALLWKVRNLRRKRHGNH